MLLDTHIFLWWLFNDKSRPHNIKKYIQNIDNPVLVSSASVWEIATKYRLGKLPEASSVAEDVPAWIQKAGFESLSITAQHAHLAGSWQTEHRDPFDRMLAAQAKIENLVLASVDRALASFDIEVISN